MSSFSHDIEKILVPSRIAKKVELAVSASNGQSLAYDTAILLAPENARLYLDKADVLFNLRRLEEALRAYSRAASSIHDEPLLDMRRVERSALLSMQHLIKRRISIFCSVA